MATLKSHQSVVSFWLRFLFSFVFFDRINDGVAFGVGTSVAQKLYVNECPRNECTHPGKGWYFLKENLKVQPTSYIVPKGSPLLASTLRKIIDKHVTL